MPFIDPKRIPLIGYDHIDDTHRDLATRVNDLYTLWQDRASGAVVVDRLDDLLRAFGRHFAEEEDIVAARGFADGGAHHDRHEDLLEMMTAEVGRMTRRANGYPDGMVDVFAVLDVVLYEHEMIEDQDFWTLFRSSPANASSESVRTVAGGPMSPPMVLDADLCTGFGAMDAQHAALFAHVNKVSKLLDVGAPAQVMVRSLEDLLDEVRAHFAWEDGLAEDAHLIDRQRHVAQHKKLLDDLKDLIGQYATQGRRPVDEGVRRYLRFWLVDHIRHVDMPMADDLSRQHAAKPDAHMVREKESQGLD